MALLGIGMAGIWAPLAATATRNLPMHLAGAGSGVYNATRQVGAVLGSAAIAVLIDSRIAAHGLSGGAEPSGALQQLPAVVREPFSQAMSDAMLLPVAVLVLGSGVGAVLPAPPPPRGPPDGHVRRDGRPRPGPRLTRPRLRRARGSAAGGVSPTFA